MNKLMIAFGIVVVLINIATLLAVFNRTESPVRYRVITSDMYDRSMSLYIHEYDWAGSARYTSMSWANIDAGRAARIAHMSWAGLGLSQPYMVMYDEDKDVFIVLGDIAGRPGVYRIVVCARTGGVLLNNIGFRASMPRDIEDWNVPKTGTE